MSDIVERLPQSSAEVMPLSMASIADLFAQSRNEIARLRAELAEANRVAGVLAMVENEIRGRLARAETAARDARAAAVEEAAWTAKYGCLVPPDGGSPTEAEADLCDEIERRIRALSPAPTLDTLRRLAEAMGCAVVPVEHDLECCGAPDGLCNYFSRPCANLAAAQAGEARGE
jgi:hypothetical protein